MTHDFLQFLESPFNQKNKNKNKKQKNSSVYFYLFKMIFLQHVARGIISGIINVNVQRESR